MSNQIITTLIDGGNIIGKVSGVTYARVQAKIDALEAGVAETDQRIDNIIATPVPTGEIIAEEIIDARQGKGSIGANITEVKSQLAQRATKDELAKEIQSTINKSLYDHHNNVTKKTVLIDNFETFGQAETGQKWTVDEGGFTTVEGGLRGTEEGTFNKAWIETGLKDKEIELVIRTLDGTITNTYFRVFFRYEDASNNYFFGMIFPSSTDIFLRTAVNGSVDTTISTGKSMRPTVLLKIRIIGNTLEWFENGILKHTTVVGDEFKNSTKVGFSLYGTTGAISGFRINEIPKIEYPQNIVASVDNMMVVYDGSNLLFSDNGGANFLKGLNIQNIGILKQLHLFSNGNILFGDDRKCYYSSDWKTYQESTLLNEDGSVFIATTDDTFYTHKRPSHKHIVNGKEIYVWGNYSIEEGVQRTNNIRVWYTTDYGATVKCAYTTNLPSTVACRHVHNVDYCAAENFFIMQTGDEPVGGAEQSHWVKGVYDEIADTWVWSVIGSGLDFKSTNIFFHSDGYAYYSWDKTPGGVRKVPIASLSDVSTHTLLFTTQRDCGYVLVGQSGDILVFQTSGASNVWRYYYSKDQIKFHVIPGEYPPEYSGSDRRQYNCIWPPDGNGKILAGVQSMLEYPSPINYFTRKEGHVWIDEQLSKFGFPNALK